MKETLDNPSLGIKVIDVREADEYEIAKVDGVPLLPLSQISERFTELAPACPCPLEFPRGLEAKLPPILGN